MRYPGDDVIRQATHEDQGRVLEAYEAWGYTGGVRLADTILIAELGAELVGVVRMVPEERTIVLRGMYIRPANRNSGIGTQLLKAAISWLEERECYCVPYAHLVGFYRQAGFHVCDRSQAPPFLRDRLNIYRALGRDVLLMYRPNNSMQSLPGSG